MAAAVTEAVRERLDSVRRQRSIHLSDRLLAIGKDCAARLKEPFRTINHGDLLYGDDGLPRLFKGNDFVHKDVTPVQA
jgi:antitoxin VapB